ncbi:MAG: hypothetical protein ACPG43_00325 [Alcanivoracaceae bacterium]
MKKLLFDLRSEAENKLNAGCEPPWSRQSYSDLISAIDRVAAGLDATIDLEDLQRAEAPLESGGQPLAETHQPEIAQLRPAVLRVQMPM